MNQNISQVFSLPEGVYQTSQHQENDVSMMEEEEEEDNDFVRNDFDIEALVDECFSKRRDDTEIMVQS